MISLMPNPLITPDKIRVLKESIIGVHCKGMCKKSGSIITNGVFEDCSCVSVFRDQVLFLSANIPDKYFKFDLRNLTKRFSDDNPVALSIIKNYIVKLPDMIQEGIGLFIEGESGLAKSSLGVYILKEAVKKQKTCFYIRMSNLTKFLFDSNSKMTEEGEYAQSIVNWIREEVDLLMIDEIDKDYKLDNPNSFLGSLVNDFFGYVYDSNKSLIVTSNKTKQSLKGIHADNVIDRLEELADVILIGTSFRNPKDALTRIMK